MSITSEQITDPVAYIAGLTPQSKREFDMLLAAELTAKWLPDPRNEPQLNAYYSEAELLLFGGAAGGGKLLALDTPIPTPMGWVAMGDIRRGSMVFDETGSPQTVTQIFDVEVQPELYRLIFDDGSAVDC